MEKQFVPSTLSSDLKDLGFDERCLAEYLRGEFVMRGINNRTFGEPLSDIVKAPLWQQAFDWFREKYNLHAEILPRYNPDKIGDRLLYSWSIGCEENGYSGYGEILNHWIGIADGHPYIEKPFYQVVNSYEEARHACLEKLIEIVKDENKN